MAVMKESSRYAVISLLFLPPRPNLKVTALELSAMMKSLNLSSLVPVDEAI